MEKVVREGYGESGEVLWNVIDGSGSSEIFVDNLAIAPAE